MAKNFTENQLEEIENSLIDTVDDNLNYMTIENKIDLLSMLKSSIDSRLEDLED